MRIAGSGSTARPPRTGAQPIGRPSSPPLAGCPTLASWHVYSPGPRLDSLRDLVVRPVAGSYPVVASEFGEKDCARGWVENFMNWADDGGISYLAWTWDTWPDCGNPVLITSYEGTPTAYGAGVRDHLVALWRASAPTRGLTPLQADAPLLAVGAALILLGLAGLGALFVIGWRIRDARRSRRVATT